MSKICAPEKARGALGIHIYREVWSSMKIYLSVTSFNRVSLEAAVKDLPLLDTLDISNTKVRAHNNLVSSFKKPEITKTAFLLGKWHLITRAHQRPAEKFEFTRAGSCSQRRRNGIYHTGWIILNRNNSEYLFSNYSCNTSGLHFSYWLRWKGFSIWISVMKGTHSTH